MDDSEPKQESLFDLPPTWKETWKGMPDFHQDDLESWKEIKVHFKNRTDLKAFSDLIGQRLTEETRSIWYPPADIGHYANKKYESAEKINPRYPVYIISKGRWESRLTSKALEAIGVPYQIVIEPQEYEKYAAVIDPRKILVLPFSNLGLGSIPARNWVWENAIERGAERHWILDDNIEGFYRLHKNLKTPVGDGAIFRAAEDFSDRYENVLESGFNYFMFASRKSAAIPPYTLNTRVYSCILLKNDIPLESIGGERWRGRYNEDTDLSIRILKSGACTILFNCFLAGKQQTMTMKGGNTDELYKEDGRKKMAESLKAQHPELVEVVWKWDRWQHHVDYKPFRLNKLKLKPGLEIPEGTNDYGMSLKVLGEEGSSAKAESSLEEVAEPEEEKADAKPINDQPDNDDSWREKLPWDQT